MRVRLREAASRARAESLSARQPRSIAIASAERMTMINIREIDHIVLRVAHPDATLRFYTEVLGCTVERRRDELGLIQLRAGRCLVDLVPVTGHLGKAGGAPPGKEGRNLDHFCFRI